MFIKKLPTTYVDVYPGGQIVVDFEEHRSSLWMDVKTETVKNMIQSLGGQFLGGDVEPGRYTAHLRGVLWFFRQNKGFDLKPV